MVLKKDGSTQHFNGEKVISAASKAIVASGGELNKAAMDLILSDVVDHVAFDHQLSNSPVSVDDIHNTVERVLMSHHFFDAAKAYITYRNKHRRSITRARAAYKPFEYPELAGYVEAIQHSYWIHTEFDYSSDKQDFLAILTPGQRQSIERCMLAISQVEVKVKDFWLLIGRWFPKPEIQEVGAVFAESECYDNKTEVLTNRGWILFKDLKRDDLIAQCDPTDKTITFVKPLAYINKHYSGLVHNYKNGRGTDFCVTENHELLIKHPQKDVYEIKTSSSGKWSKNYKSISAGYSAGFEDTLSDFERLLIAIQADGSLFGECPTGKGRLDFSINIKKDKKINRLEGIFNRLGLAYKKSERKNGFKTYNSKLPNAFDPSTVKGFDWVEPHNWNSNKCEQFIEELSHWDSNIRNENISYYSTNESAADKVQQVAILCGKSASKSINRTAEQSLKNLNPDGKKRQSAKTCYLVSIANWDEKVLPLREEYQYDGKVYCVTMPMGTVVTRRNGRVAIQGNCRHARTYAFLLELLGLNEKFIELLEVPVFKKRFEYLSRSVRGAKSDDLGDYVEALVLFTLFVENVSLFSQFLIMSTYNKELNILSGMSNGIAATSLEEVLHRDFGIELINTLRNEQPELFTDDLKASVIEMSRTAFEAECELVDWIFESGENEFLTKSDIKNYIKNRLNEGLDKSGFGVLFDDVDYVALEKTDWFDVQTSSTMKTDFFKKRSNTYTKRAEAFSEDSIF